MWGGLNNSSYSNAARSSGLVGDGPTSFASGFKRCRSCLGTAVLCQICLLTLYYYSQCSIGFFWHSAQKQAFKLSFAECLNYVVLCCACCVIGFIHKYVAYVFYWRRYYHVYMPIISLTFSIINYSFHVKPYTQCPVCGLKCWRHLDVPFMTIQQSLILLVCQLF